jgi:hypothetical protein
LTLCILKIRFTCSFKNQWSCVSKNSQRTPIKWNSNYAQSFA